MQTYRKETIDHVAERQQLRDGFINRKVGLWVEVASTKGPGAPSLWPSVDVFEQASQCWPSAIRRQQQDGQSRDG